MTFSHNNFHWIIFKEKSANLSQLWRNAAELNLRSGQPEVAARSLEEVLKSDPKNVITLAQLVISYSKV